MSEPLDLEAIKAQLTIINYRPEHRIAQWYRSDVPALVAEVERLRKERDELDAYLTEHGVPHRETQLERVAHMVFCGDLLVQAVKDLAPPAWRTR